MDTFLCTKMTTCQIMNEKRIINDVVIIGQSVPQFDKYGNTNICTVGYSLSDNSFIRLYPTHHSYGLRRWDRVQLDCERRKEDWRFESWRLRNGADDLSIRIRSTTRGSMTKKAMRLNFINSILDKSVEEINDSKRSLGIVRASSIRGHFKQNRKNAGLFQLTMKSDPDFMTRKDYPQLPHLCYKCADEPECNGHDMQLLEWGIFEYFRKNPLVGDRVFDNLYLHDKGWRHYLVVGNQIANPNSFMVISDIRFKITEGEQLSLFKTVNDP